MNNLICRYFYLVLLTLCLFFSTTAASEDIYDYNQNRKKQIVNEALDQFELQKPEINRYPDLKRINSENQVKPPDSSTSVQDSFSKYSNAPSSNRQFNPLNSSESVSENRVVNSGKNKTSPDSDKNLNLFQTGVVYDNTVDKFPRIYFETVLPLEQSPDKEDTFFTHDRISSKGDGNTTFSGGLGYRKLLFDNNLMLGGNTFFDYLTENKHYRAGLGLEFKTKTLEGNANIYKGLSPERQITDTPLVNITEEAADGFDTEVGGPLPYLPWFKIFGGYTRFYYDDAEDLKTWKQRAEVSISKFITLNAEKFNDTVGGIDYRWDARFTLAFESFDPDDLAYAFKSSKQMYPDIDLTTKTLDRVERNFNVVVQRKTNINETIVGNLFNIQMVVRFPGLFCGSTPCDDINNNHFVDAGDGLEIDVLFTNSSTQTVTGISYANATVSTGWTFAVLPNSGALPDAPAGGTSITNSGSTDLDLFIPALTAGGAQFYITLDFTADGETEPLTFGPFTVGTLTDGQVVDHL